MRGYSADAVTDTILRRMPDYVNYITPQFQHTHVNFQRVPIVDTSNPFMARDVPTADESMVVIRFAKPKGIDFAYLLSMINGSMMSRANTIVVPGGKMELAMQLIFTPFIWRMVERKKNAGSPPRRACGASPPTGGQRWRTGEARSAAFWLTASSLFAGCSPSRSC